MITITNYTKHNAGFGEFYRLEGVIDSLPYIYNTDPLNVESGGAWDEAKALSYLNGSYNTILAYARDRGVQVISKKLEVTQEVQAADFVVASPNIPTDLKKIRDKIKAEKIKLKKSIAFLSLAQAELIENLIQRVEKLEQTSGLINNQTA